MEVPRHINQNYDSIKDEINLLTQPKINKFVGYFNDHKDHFIDFNSINLVDLSKKMHIQDLDNINVLYIDKNFENIIYNCDGVLYYSAGNKIA